MIVIFVHFVYKILYTYYTEIYFFKIFYDKIRLCHHLSFSLFLYDCASVSELVLIGNIYEFCAYRTESHSISAVQFDIVNVKRRSDSAVNRFCHRVE